MLNLLLDQIAEKFPLKAALIFEDETYTYADLQHEPSLWYEEGRLNREAYLFSLGTYRTGPPERLTEKLCGRTPSDKLSANHTIHDLFTSFRVARQHQQI
jgi:hypothetical protein